MDGLYPHLWYMYVYMYGIEFNLGMTFTLVKTQHKATTIAAAILLTLGVAGWQCAHHHDGGHLPSKDQLCLRGFFQTWDRDELRGTWEIVEWGFPKSWGDPQARW